MKKFFLFITLFIIPLSCGYNETTAPEVVIPKYNHELTVSERVGNYKGYAVGGKGHIIDLSINNDTTADIILTMQTTIGTREAKSSVSFSNEWGQKVTELVLASYFDDPTDLAGPRRCFVTYNFISIDKISVSFTYRNGFYGAILTKII